MHTRYPLVLVSLGFLALAACGEGPQERDPSEPVAGPASGPASEGQASEETGAGDDSAADSADLEDGATITPGDPVVPPAPEPLPLPDPAPAAPSAPTQLASMEPPASFATCRVCHAVEPGQNGIGPSLAGVFGREAGALSGFSYSAAMQSADLNWTEANLRRYLLDPNAVVPGGSMPAPGLDSAQAAAVTSYLKTL